MSKQQICVSLNQSSGGRLICGTRPPRWPTARWCATQLGFVLEDMISQCCLPKAPCFHAAEAIGDKCCRQDVGRYGHYGFIMPTRAFLHTPDALSGSLHALEHIRIISYENALDQLEAMHLFQDGVYHTRKGMVLADVVPMPQFALPHYLRFYAPFAEVPLQAAWEYYRYVAREKQFARHWEARFQLRYGTHPCDQRDAASAQVVSDDNVLSWIGERWTKRGNKQFETYVNFGAFDGIEEDPFVSLFPNSSRIRFGLAVEGRPEACKAHQTNLPHVTLVCKWLRVEDVESVVEHIPVDLRTAPGAQLGVLAYQQFGAVPESDQSLVEPALDIVKVDLDGIDCDIIRAFLTRVLAKIVLAELNDGIPPPIQMSTHDGTLGQNLSERSDVLGAWGCSLSYQVHLMGSLGYWLVWYASPSALYVHRSVAEKVGLPGPLDEIDCYSKALIDTMWPDARTLRRWFYEVPLPTALHEVETLLSQAPRGRPLTVRI